MITIFVSGGVVQGILGSSNHLVIDFDNGECPLCGEQLTEEVCCGINWGESEESIHKALEKKMSIVYLDGKEVKRFTGMPSNKVLQEWAGENANVTSGVHFGERFIYAGDKVYTVVDLQ